MNEGRYRFGCGKFKSAAHGGRDVIVAAGGYSGSDVYPFSKVEFLDFTNDNEWTAGKGDVYYIFGLQRFLSNNLVAPTSCYLSIYLFLVIFEFFFLLI